MKPMDVSGFDGYLIIYAIVPGGQTMPQYLTPDRTWSFHEYSAEVFRTTADFEEACQWVRNQGLSPSCTMAGEQPAKIETTRPKSWRTWK